jgi:hypothetical protein
MITNKNKFVTDFQVALQVLVGLELSRQTRAGSMQCFQFGELIIIDEKKTIGDYGLHLQCPWRIINENEIIIGSEDVCEPIDENAEYDENFNWDEDGNLRDVKLNLLLNLNKLMPDCIPSTDY